MKGNSYTYKMDDDILQQVNAYKDRGVLFDPLLIFYQHISNMLVSLIMLGLIQRNFQELSQYCLVALY